MGSKKSECHNKSGWKSEFSKGKLFFIMGLLVGVLILVVIARLRVSELNFSDVSDVDLLDFFIAVSSSAILSLMVVFIVSKAYPDTKQLISFFAVMIFFILVLGYFVLVYLPKYQTALSILVTAVFLGLGWWIQTMTSTASSRKTHTLNIIVNTRLSSEYQENLRKSSHLFKIGRYMAKELAEWRDNPDREEYKNIKLGQELKDAINGTIFLLNYFEFLAQGIKYRDLDEELLRECFSGFLLNIERRGFFVIIEAQKTNPKNFEGIVYLSKRWNEKSILEEYRASPEKANLGIQFPPPKEMQKILKGEAVCFENKALSCSSDEEGVTP